MPSRFGQLNAMLRMRLGIGISALLLSIAVAWWPEMYFFSKVSHPGPWTKLFPSQLFASMFVAVVCLAPAAFLPQTPTRSAYSLSLASLLAPVPAVLIYVASELQLQMGKYLEFNAPFIYVFTILHIVLPAFFLWAMAWFAHWVREQRLGKGVEDDTNKRRFAELVAMTQREIDQTSDPRARARLEELLRIGHEMEAKLDTAEARLRKFNKQIDRELELLRIIGPYFPWIIGIGALVYLAWLLRGFLP